MKFINRAISLPKKSSFFLFGPRQVGKSTLIKHRFPSEIWVVNLLMDDVFIAYSSDPSLFRKEAITKIKKSKLQTIFVDEIQRLPNLLNEVQYIMQEYPECQFILSGSSARKLKRGAANLLGGRAIERFLFPLTYQEIEKSFDLDEVLQYGSLPPIQGTDDEEKFDILSSYVNTYLREEIQAERLVRNLGGFSRFLDVAASQSGELLNYASIARDSQLPSSTVKEYFQILEDTLIGFTLEPWRTSLRRRLTASSKFYFFDTGVINAINKSLRSKPVQPRRGRLFEHLIILEAFRNIKYRRSETELFFWRTSNGAEVDLLIHQHGKLLAAIEIKSSKQISSADLSGLRSFAKIYPEAKRYVVAAVTNEYDLEGNTVIPWQIFLKNDLMDLINQAA